MTHSTLLVISYSHQSSKKEAVSIQLHCSTLAGPDYVSIDFVAIAKFGYIKDLGQHYVADNFRHSVSSIKQYRGCNQNYLADLQSLLKDSLEAKNYSDWNENLLAFLQIFACYFHLFNDSVMLLFDYFLDFSIQAYWYDQQTNLSTNHV